MLTTAFYAGFSSDLQNPRSINDHWLVCRELVAPEGWEIVAYYHEEAVSGARVRGRISRTGDRRVHHWAEGRRLDFVEGTATGLADVSVGGGEDGSFAVPCPGRND